MITYDLTGHHTSHLERDDMLLQNARDQIEALRASLNALAERMLTDEASAALSDMADSICDLRSDLLGPVQSALEDELNGRDAAEERRHERVELADIRR